MGYSNSVVQLLLSVCLYTLIVEGYYIPGTYPKEYIKGNQLQVYVSSLKSYETELPYDYYSLPMCQPPEGIRRIQETVNPGTILMGVRVHNSPYNITIKEDARAKPACANDRHSYPPLTEDGAKNLQHKIDNEYRINMILDNMPITTYDLEMNPDSVRPGFDLGYKEDDKYYIYNHLTFNVLVHPSSGTYVSDMDKLTALSEIEVGARRRALLQTLQQNWMIVGFEVMPCSIKRDAGKKIEDITCGLRGDANNPPAQEIKEGEEIVYTYDVYWQESETGWASRWDPYLSVPGGKIHWFGIVNSILVVCALAIVVATILLRTIRKDLAKYEDYLVDQPGTVQNESGWKLVAGDAFRCPPNPYSLCVYVGSGVQILLTVAVTILFAALGFLSPAARGSLLTALIVSFIFLSITSGVASVVLLGRLSGSYDKWREICFKVCIFIPGITIFVVTILNMMIAGTGSTGAIPAGYFFSLVFLWIILSVPLTYFGGYVASKYPLSTPPVRTNQIPRHIPPPSLGANPYLMFLFAGFVPMMCLFVELFFAMSSLWQGFFYYLFGFLFIVCGMTILVVIEMAILCCYVQLCAEDYRWWWRSFHRGGSLAFFVLLYAFYFMATTLDNLSGTLSVFVYLAYMSLVVLGLYVSMGTIGFLSSYIFVTAIYSTMKSE
eukprot:TRINITY_DN6182_c0_g2_i1.p1 TRINITY_DN6182_c0_g2~~TRINITY_DN6182_c0_g2_i1.p1  ORF type:complete len:676 (+),score=29.99 TRINITY_DN6182_c0_g2_i1:38-2029(+)